MTAGLPFLLHGKMNKTIFYRTPKDAEHPFVMLPYSILYDKRLSDADFRVLCCILSNNDTWKLSINEIRRRLKIPKRTMGRISLKLQEIGYLRKTKIGLGEYLWEIFEQAPNTEHPPTVAPNRSQIEHPPTVAPVLETLINDAGAKNTPPQNGGHNNIKLNNTPTVSKSLDILARKTTYESSLEESELNNSFNYDNYLKKEEE